MRTKYPNKRPLCACGCGGFVERNKAYIYQWNKYINNHHRKEKQHSKETKLKMSKVRMGIEYSKKTKKKISKTMKRLWKIPKYRKSMSEAAIGKKHSIESIIKMSGKNNHLFGKARSPKTKLKISEAQIGKKISAETRKKLSLINSGENHPRWKGGISCEPYCDVWLDKEYKQSIRDRDDNECQNPDCSTKYYDRLLDIHHIDYIKKNCVPKNLITLCRSCNSKANTNREEHTKFYQEIMKEKLNEAT